MKYWSDKFGTILEENEDKVKVGIVTANNHYAGFGASTANMFRVMSGLPPVEWGTQKELENIAALKDSNHGKDTYNKKTRQKTLLDYASK